MRRLLLLLLAGCTIDKGPRVSPGPAPDPEPVLEPDAGQCDLDAALRRVYEQDAQRHNACSRREECAPVEPAPGTCVSACFAWVRADEADAFQRDATARLAPVCACANQHESIDCGAAETACVDGRCAGVDYVRDCGGELDGGVAGGFTRSGLFVSYLLPSWAPVLNLIPVDPTGPTLAGMGAARFDLPPVDGGEPVGHFTFAQMTGASASATRTDGLRFELHRDVGADVGDADLTRNANGQGVLRATLVARLPDGGEERAALTVKF